MDGLKHDLRDALRGLRRTPALSAVVILTLALGIGANAAIFSLLDQVLLRRLPVENPHELVVLDGPGPFMGRVENDQTFSHPMYLDFRDRNEVFDGILARYPARLTLVHEGTAEQVSGELVSGNYFQVLGVPSALGRTFGPGDDRTPGGHPVAMLSDGYWTRRFGRDPSILNQTLRVNGHPLTVVGVTPRGFFGIAVGSAPDVFVPLTMKAWMTPAWDDLVNRRSRWVNVIARLKPGVQPAQAEAAMNVLYRQINEAEVEEIPGTSARFREGFVTKRLYVLPGATGISQLRDQASTPLLVLMGMTGLVLLIACANVAGLLLVRAQADQRATTLRLALGASPARIVRHRLVESFLYAGMGTALGLLVAIWAGDLILQMAPADLGTATLSTAPDVRVTGFACVVAALTALGFGVAPAAFGARHAPRAMLREDGGAVAGGRASARLRRGFVVAQLALSIVLVAGAGLFARSLLNLQSLDPGFEMERVLTFGVDPSLSGYDQTRSVAVFDAIREEIETLPFTSGASLAQEPLLANSVWQITVRVDGYSPREDEDMNPELNGVSPGFFATLGVPLVTGREFTVRDAADAPRVAVINETMARYFFGDANPLGRRFGFARDDATAIEIVGVVRDIRSRTLRHEPRRAVFVPFAQHPAGASAGTVYVRTRGSGDTAAAELRAAVRRIDPNLPVVSLKSLEMQAGESLFLERMVALLSLLFALLATLLAAIGLYGVMSFVVSRRRREIGIRIVLGAERRTILRSVLTEAALLAGAGLVIGLPATLLLGRLVESQLYQLSAADPVAVTLAGGVLIVVALGAACGPARRATTIDPMLAVRTE